MLPQRNAYLTKIERTGGTATSGYSEDYDAPATDPEAAGGAGRDEWSGKVGVYWMERRRRVTEGESSRVLLERSCVVPDTFLEFAFENGDHLTVEHEGAVKTGKVQLIELRKMPETGGSLRLTMEDA